MLALYLVSLPLLLVFAAGGAPPCGVDAFEPNDRPGRARRLRGRPAAGVVCPGDVDWFRVHLPAGLGVEIALRHEPGAPLEPPDVFTPGRRPVAVGRPYRVDGEVGRRFVAPRSGPYRVRVRGGAPDGTPYRLRFWMEDP